MVLKVLRVVCPSGKGIKQISKPMPKSISKITDTTSNINVRKTLMSTIYWFVELVFCIFIYMFIPNIVYIHIYIYVYRTCSFFLSNTFNIDSTACTLFGTHTDERVVGCESLAACRLSETVHANKLIRGVRNKEDVS